MIEQDIPLRHTPLARRARLRDMVGHAELSATGAGTRIVIQLIDRLLVAGEGSLQPGSAADLPAADRDQVLAAIYRAVYGDKIESTVRCRGCDRPFDISFSLGALNSHLTAGADDPTNGTLRLDDGRMVRLPVGRDECAVVADNDNDPERKLAERCLDGSVTADDMAALTVAMERSAPMLAADLESACPECGHREAVAFDIQSFLLGSLMRDRPGLIREIHSIALAYHWTLDAILALPRVDRRALVAAIESRAPRTVGRALAGRALA